jgi:hypothetical protein
MKGKIMKTNNKNGTDSNDEMLDEYEFDYSKAKPNKFAQNFNQSTIKVYDDGKLIKEMKPILVEVDIINHFKTSVRINKALRSLIHTNE